MRFYYPQRKRFHGKIHKKKRMERVKIFQRRKREKKIARRGKVHIRSTQDAFIILYITGPASVIYIYFVQTGQRRKMFESGNAAFQPMEKARNGSIEKVITIE
jgi:hypothetical protein